MEKQWSVVIGIEIHAHILSQSKMFSPDKTDFTLKANQHIHPVSLGLPGSLPFLNQKAIESALKAGRAFHCKIQKKSIFARKHYFYPDLPKGYQISQHSRPLLQGGFVEFFHQNQPCKIHLDRIHLEEDAGRLLHQKNYSLVDFNRAGVPLLEIVSKPEMTSPAQAAQYGRMVRNILIYLQVCDGSLQEGSMRFDCNISLRPSPAAPLGVKVELKNLNSFRFMEKALAFEVKRQSSLLNKGGEVLQETRLFDPKKGETFPMRKKETASDYRYFPDPDLPPLIVSASKEKPAAELPFQKTKRFCQDYSLPLESALILTEDPELCSYFEQGAGKSPSAAALCKWIINEVLGRLKEDKRSIKDSPVSALQLAELVHHIENKTLSSKMAKDVFSKMWETKKGVQELIKELNLKKLDDPKTLSSLIDQVIQKYPEQCRQYQQGKTTVYKFLMGQAMKLSKGQADPVQADALLKEKLKNHN